MQDSLWPWQDLEGSQEYVSHVQRPTPSSKEPLFQHTCLSSGAWLREGWRGGWAARHWEEKSELSQVSATTGLSLHG